MGPRRDDYGRLRAQTLPGIVALSVVVGCSVPGADPPEGISQQGVLPSIEQVLDRETDAWMAIPGVVGTGLGLCAEQPCIKIFATGAVDELQRQIPGEVDGYPVVIELTGAFRARDTIGEG
jgi:hypothetical protein